MYLALIKSDVDRCLAPVIPDGEHRAVPACMPAIRHEGAGRVSDPGSLRK